MAILIALFSRFYSLTELSAWPRFDESLCAYSAVELSERWDWRLRHLGWGVLPLNTWGLALLFKAIGPSLFSLWLFPALQSILTVAIGYLAARQFWPHPTPTWAALLLAGSFWPAYTARFSLQPNMMLLVEVLALYLLGLYLNASYQRERQWRAFFLGAALAAGTYTYPAFLVLLPWVAAISLRLLWVEGSAWRSGSWVLWGSFLMISSPIFLTFLLKGSGNYLQGISAIGGPWDSRQWEVVGSYLASVFFYRPEGGDYAPVGGAFMNPILAAALFVGVRDLWKTRREPLSLSLLSACLLFPLPACLTRYEEYFRISVGIPLLYAVCALGVVRVLQAGRMGRSLVPILFVLSMVWDGYRLFRLYPDQWAQPGPLWAENIKSIRGWRTFRTLGQETLGKGPGAVLENLDLQPLDQSLHIALYPFNTSSDPRFTFEDSRWIAARVNLHYRPFLKARFPEALVLSLDPEGRARYGGEVLFLCPVSPGTKSVFFQWFEMDQALKKSTHLAVNRGGTGPRTEILEELGDHLPLAQGDPFLASCLWERIYSQLNYEVAWGEVAPERNLGTRILVLERALKEGYPLAHLWNELGNLYGQSGRPGEAARCFRQALKAPLNRTKALEHLRRLKGQERSRLQPLI